MYKFYSIPKKDTESIIDKIIGEQASIKLSSAFDLNDPFELKFNLKIDPLAEGHEEEYYKNHPSSTKQDFLNWQKHVLEHNGYICFAEQNQRNDIAQSITLCSFSESNKGNLMWSHYTDNHKGICVEYKPELFEYLKTAQGFLAFEKVEYSSEPPVIEDLKNLYSTIQKTMFNKQLEWNYEKEHRVVFLSNDTEYLTIDRKYIKAVYIGSHTENETVEKILKICDNSNIDMHYGITLGKTYEVAFKKHKKGIVYSRSFW